MTKWYDKNSCESRLGEMRNYANEVASYVAQEAKILEIAPGLGYLSIELAKKGYKVTGVEISPEFVKIAKNNAKQNKVQVDFKEGSVASVPCEDQSFDFIICTAAFKNFADPIKVLCEMY